MYCIETSHLSYKFSSKEIVLNDINIQVPERSIYGFLGPNGAGKTTTLRLLLGLLKKQDGQVYIFGKPFNKHRVEILKNTGSLIESPSIYAHLTAKENLEVLQKVYQCPKNRVQKALDMVSLSNTGNKTAGQFSLGMKQRLSIAIALLHKPTLLILDEPSNGLDPNGIIEIRELLKRLNKEEGMTIVVSSHLLPEIEKLVTHLGIINKGRLLFQGEPSELYHLKAQTSFISLHTSDPDKTMEILRANNLTPVLTNAQILIPAAGKEIVSKIIGQLVAGKIDVYQVNTIKNDLESIFIELVKN